MPSCGACRQFQKLYIHSTCGERDFGIRDYGHGWCMRRQRVTHVFFGCRNAHGRQWRRREQNARSCKDCAHRMELFSLENGVYVSTGLHWCMGWWKDANGARRCSRYSPKQVVKQPENYRYEDAKDGNSILKCMRTRIGGTRLFRQARWRLEWLRYWFHFCWIKLRMRILGIF